MDLTQRSFSHRCAARLIVGALAVISLLIAWSAARNGWRTRGALLASEADEAGRTAARVIHGHVVASPTTTPLRPGHIAWMARVGHWINRGKGTVYVPTCTTTRIDGLRIEDARTRETAMVSGFEAKTVDFAKGLTIDEPQRVAVDLRRIDAPAPMYKATAATAPEPLRTLCKDSLPSDGFEYEERWVELGDDVTVRGCAATERRGTDLVIAPCGDGLDVVTTSGLAGMRRKTRDENSWPLVYGAGAAFVGLGLLGLLASMRLVRSHRRRGATP